MWQCPFCSKMVESSPNADCDCKRWLQFLSEQSITTSDVKSPKYIARDETLVVNFFGGPGSGKSTLAAGVFSELKFNNINCELAFEFAKDLTWEKRYKTFEDQIYIFGKQYHRIKRLMGQVEVIITDSPLLLTPIYDAEKRETLKQLALEEHNKMWTYNAFITRKKEFNPKGRLHNEAEAKNLDRIIMDMFDNNDVAYEVFDGTRLGLDDIVKKIELLLNWKEEAVSPEV